MSSIEVGKPPNKTHDIVWSINGNLLTLKQRVILLGTS